MIIRHSIIGAAMLIVPTIMAAQAPAEWRYQVDGGGNRPPVASDPQPGDWGYQRMPPGWHLTTTTQGVTMYPITPHPMTGRWGVEVELFLFDNPSDEGLGIAVQATENDQGAHEIRFLMRRDGQAAVVFSGPEGDSLVVPWTRDTAAVRHPGTGVVRNLLRLEYDGTALVFSVNGREMTARMFDALDGYAPVAGLRAGAGLNIHVSRFDLITPLAPPRQRTR